MEDDAKKVNKVVKFGLFYNRASRSSIYNNYSTKLNTGTKTVQA